MKNQERKLLDAFVTDTADLERLEAMLNSFNLFEAIGVVKQELRHSNLLAFLLNPQKNHGLGDAFVKRLLKKILITTQDMDRNIPITLIDIDTWNFNNANVYREWKNIDILFIDNHRHLAVIIENKIGTSEHSNQLQRYYQQVRREYPKCRIMGLYLTPDGTLPSEDTYIAIEYSLICAILEDLIESKEATLNSEVVVMVRHYTQMLRRHIMDNSEIADLCQRIYRKHQQALDLIYEHRPDRQTTIREMCEELIKQQSDLIPDDAVKNYIRFIPKSWDIPALREAQGWTSSHRILLFEFVNLADKFGLDLVIGPGPLEIQQKIRSVFQPEKAPLKPSSRKKWVHIPIFPILEKESYEDSFDEVREKLEKQWLFFLESDLPKFDAKIKGQEWLVQSPQVEN